MKSCEKNLQKPFRIQFMKKSKLSSSHLNDDFQNENNNNEQNLENLSSLSKSLENLKNQLSDELTKSNLKINNLEKRIKTD